MQAAELGQAVTHLAGLSPAAASLVALAREPDLAAWTGIRRDPGCVLLLLRSTPSSTAFSPNLLREAGLLETATRHLDQGDLAFVDWSLPAAQPIYLASIACAEAACRIAERARLDPECAWIAGLLAPLGWLAVCGINPESAADCRNDPEHASDPAAVECSRWGFSAAGIARRLARRWRLPAWLADVVRHLSLPIETAAGLGASAKLLRVVQLAVGIVEQQGCGLRLEVGTPVTQLTMELGLSPEDTSFAIQPASGTPLCWQAPAGQPLLRDLLCLAAATRRLADSPVLERLEGDVDQLQRALGEQRASETRRLLAQKLNTLAEFAAGAGHEINNPLAVISGQAQYLLVHEADPDRQKSLQKIIGQTQRVHEILTELMQFARPGKPQKQRVNLGSLIREVAIMLGDLAGQKQVRLVCPEPESPVAVYADSRQLRMALTGLLRNAIEAAPIEGWAGIQVRTPAADLVEFWVEDSGSGPTPAQRENMFDPFYSGRQAGRGRGLGLPTAWRLARENGGDVVYSTQSDGPTRFVLSLPRAPESAHTNGNGHYPSVSPPALPPPTNGHGENANGPAPIAEF